MVKHLLRWSTPLLLAAGCVPTAGARVFTLDDGKSADAKIEEVLLVENELTFKLDPSPNGVYDASPFPLHRFIPADQEYLLKTLRGPWSSAAEAGSFGSVDKAIYNLDTGALAVPGWGRCTDLHIVRNAPDGWHFEFEAKKAERGFVRPEELGWTFAISSSLVRLPEVQAKRARAEDDIRARKTTDLLLSADLQSAIFLRDHDLWTARVDWLNTVLVDERRVTDVRVLNTLEPIAWHRNFVYLPNPTSKDKNVLKIDLDAKTLEETDLHDLYHPERGYRVRSGLNSTATLLVGPLPDREWEGINQTTVEGQKKAAALKAYRLRLGALDFSTGKFAAFDNFLADDRDVPIFRDLGTGWLDDHQIVAFHAGSAYGKGGIPIYVSRTAKESLFYIADVRAGTVKQLGPTNGDVSVQIEAVKYAPSYHRVLITRKKFVPGPKSDVDEKPAGEALYDLETGKSKDVPAAVLDLVPRDKLENLIFLNDDLCILPVKEGGLNKVGTWLFNWRDNSLRRIYPRVLGDYVWMEARNELWFVSSSTVCKANASKGDAVETSLPKLPVRVNPELLDLGIKPEALQAYNTGLQQRQGTRTAVVKKETEWKERFRILRDFEVQSMSPTPRTLVEGKDGVLYGLTSGGRFQCGLLYRMAKDGSGYEVLHTFNGAPGEANNLHKASGLLLGADGKLYGTTSSGGRHGGGPGSLFQYDPETKKFDTILSSQQAPNGLIAFGGPVLCGSLSDGSLYGICNGNEIVNIDPEERTVVMHHHSMAGLFHYTLTDGNPPHFFKPQSAQTKEEATGPVLAHIAGRLYSLLRVGGRGHVGAIVSVKLDGSDYRVDFEFAQNAEEGYEPMPLVLLAGKDGSLYGMTRYGGKLRGGTIFRFKPGAEEAEFIHALKAGGRQDAPLDVMGMGPDGTIYFPTLDDELTALSPGGGPAKILRKVEGAGFDTGDTLLIGSDGALYGTTEGGGAKKSGYAFGLKQ